MTINNMVCVIGGDHHNMLGIIRMLGEKKVTVKAIITSDSKKTFCDKSKYLKECFFINNEKDIISKIKEFPKGTILIPTGDDAAFILDKHYDKLENNYIVPSINKCSGYIHKYMNKFYQSELLKKYNLKVANSYILNIGDNISKYKKYPLILKPLLSIEGKKSDITIVENFSELNSAVLLLKKLGYKRILVQDYINMDYECGLNGCSCDGQTVIPAVLRKIRRFPLKKGNVSFGKIIPLDNVELDFSPIYKMLKDINYNGLFDIEIFVNGNDYYVNEINFRNSGNSYVYTKGGVNIALIWVMLNLNKNIDDKKCVSKEYYFRDEILELKQLFQKNITFCLFLNSLFKSKCNFILNFRDPKPFFKLFINFLRR